MAPRCPAVIDVDGYVSAAEGIGRRLEIHVVVRVLPGTTGLIHVNCTQSRVATGRAGSRIASVWIRHVDLVYPSVAVVPVHTDSCTTIPQTAVVRGVVAVVPQHRVEPKVVPRAHPIVADIGGMIADHRPIRLPDGHGCVADHPVAIGVVEADISQLVPEVRPVHVDVVKHRLIPITTVEGPSHLPVPTKAVDPQIVGFLTTAVTVTPPVTAAAPSFGSGHINLHPHMAHRGMGHGATDTDQKEQWQQPAPQADCQTRGFHDGSHDGKFVQDAVVG